MIAKVAGPVGAEAVGTECVESTEDAGHLNALYDSEEIHSFDSRVPECVSDEILECVSSRSSSDVVDPHSWEVCNDLGNSEGVSVEANSEGVSIEVHSKILGRVSGRALECVSNEEVRASEGLASSDVFVPSRKPVELPGQGIDREVEMKTEGAAADSGYLDTQVDVAGVEEEGSAKAAGHLKPVQKEEPGKGDAKIAEFVP